MRTLIIVSLIAAILSGCNSHAYWSEAMQYHAAAQEVLIANSICNSGQDCQKKELLFAEGGEFKIGFIRWGGAYISLYQTNDEKIVQEITEKFRAIHEKLSKPAITLTVYSSKHLEPNVEFRKVVIK